MTAALDLALADTNRAAETAAQAAALINQGQLGDARTLLAAVKRYADSAETALAEVQP